MGAKIIQECNLYLQNNPHGISGKKDKVQEIWGYGVQNNVYLRIIKSLQFKFLK